MTAPTITPNTVPRVLAFTGVGLLLAAAISVVSARWELFGPGARLVALLAASGVLVAVTHWIRRMAPSTARALDVLIAAMVPIDTAAAAIVLGGSWRVALVAAGPVSVVVGGNLRGRGMPAIGGLGIGVGGVLSAAGLAAQFELHGPLVLAVVALATALAVHGRNDRRLAAGWAVLAGLVPAARLLDEAVFTGMGTLRELGLIDPTDLTTALVVGSTATAALATLARRERSMGVGLAGLGVAITTGLEAWAITDPPAEIGVLSVAVVVALIELANPRRLPVSDDTIELIESVNEAVLLALTTLVGLAAWTLLIDDPTPLVETPLTAAVVAATWLIGDLRRDDPWLFAFPGLIVGATAAAFLASDEPVVLAATLLMGATAALVADRPGRSVVGVGGASLAPFLVVDATSVVAVAAVAAAGAVVLTLSIVRRGRTDDPLVALGVAVLLLHGLVGAGRTAFDWSFPGAVGGLVVVWWLCAVIYDRSHPLAGALVRILALLAPLVLLGDAPGWATIIATVVTLAGTAEHQVEPSRTRFAIGSAGGAVAYLALLAWLEIDLLDAYLVPLVWAAVAFTVTTGAARDRAAQAGLVTTTLITVAGRIADGRPEHIAVLGGVAVVVAIAAGRLGDRATLAGAASLAVAAACFDLLDRSVGVESWGWLVIGGAAAVTAAVLLERQDAEAVDVTSVG